MNNKDFIKILNSFRNKERPLCNPYCTGQCCEEENDFKNSIENKLLDNIEKEIKQQ